MKPLEQQIEEEHEVFAKSMWGMAYLDENPIAQSILKRMLRKLRKEVKK